MTDLCLTCQQNTTKLLRAANLPDNEKSDCVREQQEHLDLALTERSVYKEACKEATDNFQTIEDTIDLNETHAPCSTEGTMHYSFDYAQQYIIRATLCSLAPFILKLLANAESSALCVRLFRGR